MSDEIKEILDRIKNYPEKLYCLNNKEKTILLNHITNLQQENQTLQENNQSMQEEMARVWEENERLQQIYTDEYNLRHKLSLELSIEKDKNIELEDYKSRVEKAIEYINNFSVDKSFSFPLMKRWEESQVKGSIDYEFKTTLYKELLNILQGAKDE